MSVSQSLAVFRMRISDFFSGGIPRRIPLHKLDILSLFPSGAGKRRNRRNRKNRRTDRIDGKDQTQATDAGQHTQGNRRRATYAGQHTQGNRRRAIDVVSDSWEFVTEFPFVKPRRNSVETECRNSVEVQVLYGDDTEGSPEKSKHRLVVLR